MVSSRHYGSQIPSGAFGLKQVGWFLLSLLPWCLSVVVVILDVEEEYLSGILHIQVHSAKGVVASRQGKPGEYKKHWD